MQTSTKTATIASSTTSSSSTSSSTSSTSSTSSLSTDIEIATRRDSSKRFSNSSSTDSTNSSSTLSIRSKSAAALSDKSQPKKHLFKKKNDFIKSRSELLKKGGPYSNSTDSIYSTSTAYTAESRPG